ncbi:MAG: hypothetical protein HY283_08420 [Nitrospirae bacterium]|nr:hypothetical protein [Nitrospirota bacterium]
MIPVPFSRGVFIWGDPVRVSKDADRAGLEQKRNELEHQLRTLTEKADRYWE